MKNKSVKTKNTAKYYAPELLPFVYCIECLIVVLEENEKAAEIYDDIVEWHKSPGAIELFSKLSAKMPDGVQILKKIVEKSGFDYMKPPDKDTLGIPYSRGLLKGTIALISDYADRFTPWLMKNKMVKSDLMVLLVKIEELVKVGFNSESDQEQGTYKITADGSKYLTHAVLVLALSETHEAKLSLLENVNVLRTKRESYSLSEIVNNTTSRRIREKMAKQFKKAGFMLKHDETISNTALDWYQTRVRYSGPEEYCRKLQLLGRETIDPANLSNKIRVCDEILGYQRVKRKNKPDGQGTLEIATSGFGALLSKIKVNFKKKTTSG